MLSVEGMNKSAISRVKKIGWNTVHRWLDRAGESCRNYSNKTLKCFEIEELQVDEVCTFVGNKKKATWIFTAMEVWSRLWPATIVGRRSYWNTFELLGQVQQKSEGNKRPLIVTDGFQFYEKAINKIFKVGCLYAQVIKTRGNNRIIKVERREIIGTETQFEEALRESEDSNTLNTSFIERLNLTIRQATSYLTRRTTCYARRQEQLANQLEIVRCYYNFLRPHNSLKIGKETRTPAMQAGLTNRRLSFREIFKIRFLLLILDRIRRLIGTVMVYETRVA